MTHPVHRTPDSRFAHLPDYAFDPHYLTVGDGLRMHYVDEGPADAAPVLMLHGEPTWSYLYRHMIGPVAAAGRRVLAPDLIGFGKSDKPTDPAAFSYAGHVAWLRSWFEQLDLRQVTLVCQDWGSLLGLRLLAELPDRFARVVLSNGGLPVGGPFSRAFGLWRAFSRWSPVFPIGRIVSGGTKRGLSLEERRAYDAPFTDRASQAAARVFPSLVPIAAGDPAVPAQLATWQVLEAWDKPFVCCFSDGDPITRGGGEQFIARVPGARGQAHCTLRGGHFIQEDDPAGFVAAILHA